MILRDIQHITSDYGPRVIDGIIGKFHNGLDLRCYDDAFTVKLPVVLPEDCIFKAAVNEADTWGWTFIFTPQKSGVYEIRFTHMAGNSHLKLGELYEKKFPIGVNTLTQYMKNKKLGEHLHFSTWESEDKHFDPKDYYDKLKIAYAY